MAYGSGYRDFRYDKQRGGCLTIWLSLMTIGGAIGIFASFIRSPDIAMFQITLPEWYQPVKAFIAIVYLVCVIGMWMWKKWGFYGIVLLNIAGVVIHLMIGIPFLWAVGGLVGLIILWILVNPVMNQFE